MGLLAMRRPLRGGSGVSDASIRPADLLRERQERKAGVLEERSSSPSGHAVGRRESVCEGSPCHVILKPVLCELNQSDVSVLRVDDNEDEDEALAGTGRASACSCGLRAESDHLSV
jgi:hypothetical protein